MTILLVEGITDVNLVRYIYAQIDNKFDFYDFIAPKRGSKSKVITFKNKKNSNFQIVNLKGQDNLLYALQELLKPDEDNIQKIAIISDADRDFEVSNKIVTKAIADSKIDEDKFSIFLTPNNSDIGNLETLLLSSLDRESIPQLQCFQAYKKCLTDEIEDIEKRAIDKHEVEAYIKFSKKPRNRNQAQFSFIDNNEDTGLWDLSKDEFQPLIEFVKSSFLTVEGKQCK
jgi:hypothetical protein